MDRAITWEWLAGFFDGEGHFTKPCWRIEKGQPYIDLNVKVDQKKEERNLLEEIADFIEKEVGKRPWIGKHPGKAPERKNYIVLIIKGRKNIKKFCEKIKPHLRTKSKQKQVSRELDVIELYEYLLHKEKMKPKDVRSVITRFAKEYS